MEHLPAHLGLAFGLTTALTVYIFYRAAHSSRPMLAGLLLWLLGQGMVGRSGFYTVTNTLPPRLSLLLGPPLLLLVGLFATRRGRAFLDGLRLDVLTLLHLVRLPVELVLFGLFLHRAVPGLMTFEGRNWDILSGLSAPVVYYLVFRRQWLGTAGLLLWNILGLGLLLNIVINAMLSVPSPLQQFAFEQPNVGILYFPFVWLPGCVVPLVLVAHLVAIRQLWLKARTANPQPAGQIMVA
ncbi:hypothetical protein [Hymenobacter lucidus]|uniref:Uncharacterized protein n=1 Tax=Hymenobacter lucidus TaxID=2880930 RepID=A0ABS8AYG6_9BACT|nr:hypothetical protein [Hymenobacter lucidus]MCB2410860.1 hypothetical protein [Hymenobacter lucidus]